MSFSNVRFVKMAKKVVALTIATSLIFSSYGCQQNSDNTNKNGSEGTTDENGNNLNSGTNVAGNIVFSNDEMFTDRDMEIGYDEASAIKINLNNCSVESNNNSVSIKGTTVTISKEGVYVFSGTLDEGQIVVDAGDTDKVQIVLDNATITCKKSAAIYVKKADKVFITTANNSINTLKTTEEYVNTDDTNIDGVIFAKANVTLNGAGILNVDSSKGHGVVCKDDLKIMSGTYNINAASNALSGKDSIRIAGGTFNLISKTACIHSENENDAEKGYIYIAGGDIKISSEKDGIKASSYLNINGGNIDISKSVEGLEAMYIDINGGNISINSSDDGINASGGNSNSSMKGDSSIYINITGGCINVNSKGDGVDSNGNIYVSGGELYVTGPESSGDGALDYEIEGIISGGIVVAAGYSGMAVNFSSSSTQGAILVNITDTVTGEVKLTNESGEKLVRYTPKKAYNSVVISTPKIEVSKSYTVSMGDKETIVTMDNLIYGEGMHMGGGNKPGRGERPDGMDMPNRGERPDGMDMPNKGERPDGMEPPNRGEIPDMTQESEDE